MYSVIPTSYSSDDQNGYIFKNIDCQFLICESCFWTATIFNLDRKWDKNSKRTRNAPSRCPMCLSTNISIISLSTYNDDSNDDNDVCKLRTPLK